MKCFVFLIPILLELSSANVLHPRKTASCQDACGKHFAGKTMTPDKSVVLSDCNSFLATTVAAAATTITTTVPLAVFANQTIEENTRYTITPLQNATQAVAQPPIPTYMNDFGCQSAAGTNLDADQYTSLCQCAGAKVTKTKVPASTVTVTVHVPTQVSSFKIRVVFENGTYNYLDPQPYNVAGGEWVGGVVPAYANTTKVKASFAIQNGTLMYKSMNLMEYERVLPSLADGTPQLVWFVTPKEERMKNSRPFVITHKYFDNKMHHPLVPYEGGAGIEYKEFFICESCGNQLYITTSAWKDGYIKRMATDKWDRYDWVELHAEPDF
ncbi:hypothetical protein ONS95_010040 [Cadophora gregata]|uniref:uncharacterized protein n=1 Tax=Cadophora gregata TaxID=51156 RepID=UPI0026DD4786|nr:uncharacterized protein ONS95_010040 [Cadophora gregata]KAK0121754.1 hypothetical protein ONS95_010040 [Cadophora gregata]KAK0127230.1 hypothetical protein ONS96_006783 [Cadophora gregata f. sp. sojae]